MDVKERVCPLPSLFFPFFSFPLLLLIGLLLLVCGLSGCNPKPVIFNFGDSNSDTGTYFIMHGRISQISQTLAQSLSIQTQGRMSDGQLVLDFFCESLNAHYLSPFLESMDANFTNGVNFAMSGSSIAPTSVFFSLQNQVAHFSRFKRRSLDFVSKGDKDLLGNEDFENAIYVIDIGQNDIDAAFSSQSYVVAVQRIPFFISEIENAMWVLYQQGARKFWVHNTGPLGCLPKTLTSSNFPATDLDQHGCVTSFNSGAQLFNEGLRRLRDKLAHEMKDAIIVYVDIYAIKYDLIANSSVYGFENAVTACCGYGGGQYNYDPIVQCGVPGFKVCEKRSDYVNWDGIHYTEASNKFVANKILTGHYSTPQVALADILFSSHSAAHALAPAPA